MAFSRFPLITIFLVFDGPISLRSNGRPNQFKFMPRSISGYATKVDSEASLKSQAEAIHAAPPKQ